MAPTADGRTSRSPSVTPAAPRDRCPRHGNPAGLSLVSRFFSPVLLFCSPFPHLLRGARHDRVTRARDQTLHLVTGSMSLRRIASARHCGPLPPDWYRTWSRGQCGWSSGQCRWPIIRGFPAVYTDRTTTCNAISRSRHPQRPLVRAGDDRLRVVDRGRGLAGDHPAIQVLDRTGVGDGEPSPTARRRAVVVGDLAALRVGVVRPRT